MVGKGTWHLSMQKRVEVLEVVALIVAVLIATALLLIATTATALAVAVREAEVLLVVGSFLKK